jgi:DNA-directed RNA polymerase specialized sigma24 family protein
VAESLLAFFYRRVRSKEVAADLVAETFAVRVRGAWALP